MVNLGKKINEKIKTPEGLDLSRYFNYTLKMLLNRLLFMAPPRPALL